MKEMLKRLMGLTLAIAIVISAIPISAADAISDPPTLQIGDLVQIGTFYDPIVWRVADFVSYSDTDKYGNAIMPLNYETGENDTEAVLLIADKIITARCFDSGFQKDEIPPEYSSHYRDPAERVNGSNYWGDSNLRAWLNSNATWDEGIEWPCGYPPDGEYHDPYYTNGYDYDQGFLRGFTPTEIEAIIPVSQEVDIDAVYDGNDEVTYPDFFPTALNSQINQYKGSVQTEYSEDKIFIPNIWQIGSNGTAGYTETATWSMSDRYDSSVDENCYPYWILNAADGTGCNVGYQTGAAGEIGNIAANTGDIGVLPACYVNPEMLIHVEGEEWDFEVNKPNVAVTFDAGTNGGLINGKTSETRYFKEGTDVLSLEIEAEKDGYDFWGWGEDPEQTEGSSMLRCETDTTIYAVFAKEQEIYLYDGNSYPHYDSVYFYNNDTEAEYPLWVSKKGDGWTFEGWTTDNESTTVEYNGNDTVIVPIDTHFELYAIFSKDITVTFAEPGMDFSDVRNYKQYWNAANYSPSPVKVPAPDALEATDSYFKGWETVIDDTHYLYAPNMTIDVNDDTEFHGLWAEAPAPEYTVTYNYEENGGTSATATTATVSFDRLADLTPTAEKEGYEFVGWNTDPEEFTGLDQYAVMDDTTLYAIFKKTKSIRLYARNNIIYGVEEVCFYNNDSETSLNAPFPEDYEGWSFTGWISNTNDFEGYIEVVPVFDDESALYAIYGRDLYLSFETSPGASIEEMQDYQHFNAGGRIEEIEFVLPDAPDNKLGLNFVCWAIGSKTGERHDPGDHITVTEDTTVYAVWDTDEIEKHTVTYDYESNGGTAISIDPASKEVVAGTSADLSPTATKTGWEFVGWNTDKFAEKGLSELTVTKDTTLFAIYKKVLKVTYKMGSNPDIIGDVVLYNNETTGEITAPEPPAVSGYTAEGWRNDENASYAQYKGEEITVNGSVTLYPVYSRFVTLSYDVDGANDAVASETKMQYRNHSGTATGVDFTLASAPAKTGYTFTGWQRTSETFPAGQLVAILNDTTVKALWSKTPEENCEVVYNYTANGGTSATKASDSVVKGSNADLTPTAVKEGFVFVGWNTNKNAKTALKEYEVNNDVIFYAIFKKTVTAKFYSIGGALQDSAKGTYFNNEKGIEIEAPTPYDYVGWTVTGWRDDKHPLEKKFAPGKLTITKDTDFYAIYEKEITVYENTGSGDVPTKYIQHYNASGTFESVNIVPPEPKPREEERFIGWVIQPEEGNTIAILDERPVLVDNNTRLIARWAPIPGDDCELPQVQTGSATVSSTTAATVSAKVEDDGGDDIIERGIVYWSKIENGSKYTVLTSADGPVDLTNLSPETEYFYYAFAENALGTGKGNIKSFTTASDRKPNSLTIDPEYVSIEKGTDYQLLVTLLPVSVTNRSIIWSSSDSSIATVDSEGKIKGLKEGQAIITATSEVGRLTAECIVDVTDSVELKEYDFSEWNMATNTSYYAADGLGYDWDTANDGGNHLMATAYLARWDGAVLEDNDKYPKTYNYNPEILYKEKDSDFHVQNVEWLPKREGPLDNDEVKAALMKFGAVYTMICVDWDCFNSTYSAYYCPYDINYNGHAITIVGWDDNYSKSNFSNTPPKNGAFICKNSWGDGIGEDGFFYVSYYDQQIGYLDEFAVVTGIEKNTNYNKIYQYDPLGAVGYMGYEETTYAANVFPQNGKALTADEILRAVSFYTYHKNTTYDVYVVTDYTGKSSLKLTEPVITGVMENAGYHTVNLKNPITLKSGTRFAIVVKFVTPGLDSYVYCEYPVYGYSSNAKANSDESYYSSNGKKWYDLTEYIENSNFCIKAFTDNGYATMSSELYSGIDNANREYENDAVYTLQGAIEEGLPINEDYVDYVNNTAEYKTQNAAVSKPNLGSIPGITISGRNSTTFNDGAMFPKYFDLRDTGLVSSVKDQGDWGTCWAHTMYASLESNILRKMKTSQADETATNVVPDSMQLSREEVTMSAGAAITLAKKITPASASNKSVFWISSNENVATVDTNGTIRAIGTGHATISATTVSGAVSKTCSIVVEGENVDEIVSFEEKRIKKSVGDVFMIAYSVTPMKSESYDYGWISNNTNVATVSTTGVITAVSKGSAEISIVGADGVVRDSVTVEVDSAYNCSIATVDESDLKLTGETLAGKVDVAVNNGAVLETASIVIFAVYDGNKLIGVKSVPVILKPGENNISLEDIEIDGVKNENYTVKILSWSSYDKVTPISKTSR